MAYTNIVDFQNAVKNANPNPDGPALKIELAPGVYNGNVDLDFRNFGEIQVIMHGVTINGDPNNKLQKYALDICGNNIYVFADGLKLNGGNDAALGVRGHNLSIISDLKGIVTGHNRGCLLMGTNIHIQGLNFDGLGNVGISGKGFPIKDNLNRTYGQDFGWFPSHNWRVTQCIFQNIQPIESGDAGGGFRIIPHAKDVMVDNCIFRNIKGSGLWGDHNQKGFEWYYNTFEDIDTAEAFGKAMFLEIMDPDPNDKSGFVAKIAGNVFRRCDTQTILIAASSGQNPNGIDIFGNIIEDGWGITAGAMQRQFKRKWDFRDRSKDEAVDARLENIRIRKNVINPSAPNHISIFQGKNSGLIEIDNNYYVTGGVGSYTRPDGSIVNRDIDGPKIYASGSDSDSLFIHGDANGLALDKNALTGEMPTVFPFPEAWDEIPIPKIPISDGAPIIVIPDPDPDPIITPPPVSNDLPDVWIVSDYSGVTDKDDFCAMAFALLCAKDRYNIKGITVGAHPLAEDFSNPLEIYKATHGKALKEELGLEYPVYLADNWGNRFKNNIIYGDSISALIEEIRLHSKEKPLYILNWGPTTEIAVMVHQLLSMNSELLDRFVIISHFTAKETDNNFMKDKEASQYIKDKAKLELIQFIELDRGGADKIGRSSSVEMDRAILDSKIGAYFAEKWGDMSDGATLVSLAFPELGFGPDWIDSAKKDGTSNLTAFNNTFGDQKGLLYQIIEQYGRDALNGDGGPVIPDPIVDPPNVGPDLDKIKQWAIIIRDNSQKIIEELT